ncbi:MAG TPA: DUF2189 domain-containing protein [Burkholderiaceae bacterium]|nr:DUF2189 domain-containing protein [Burkholderiaceae bacterium]
MNTAAPSPFPEVRHVAATAPLQWLRGGLGDLLAAPLPSLFYGAAFAIMGWALHFVFGHAYEYTSSLAAGFLLMGPFLCIGLYEISRRIELGRTIALRATLVAWRPNLGAISFFTLLLTGITLVWARASLVIFALFFSDGLPTVSKLLERVVSLEHWDFVVTYFGVGAGFATLVYAIGVVSMPLMLDRGTDTVVAAITSVRACTENPGALALWAFLIVVLVGAGFATLYVGLVVTAPLVGHASWHAYRAVLGAGGVDPAHAADAAIAAPGAVTPPAP